MNPSAHLNQCFELLVACPPFSFHTRHALTGWTAAFIWFDVLHLVYLGTGNDFVSAAIMTLVNLGVFGYGPVDRMLGNVFEDIGE